MDNSLGDDNDGAVNVPYLARSVRWEQFLEKVFSSQTKVKDGDSGDDENYSLVCTE